MSPDGLLEISARQVVVYLLCPEMHALYCSSCSFNSPVEDLYPSGY